jgi:uncharacterized protein
LFFFLALVAEILGTVGGFGSSVLFVPMANFFLDFQSVLAITGIFHVVSNVSKIWLFREHFNWKLVLLIGVPSILLVAIGAYFSAHWNNMYLRIILGIFLCSFAVFFYLKPAFRVSHSRFNLVFFGGSAGFLAGLIGTGGALRGVALSSLHLSKNVFVWTSAIIDFGVDATRSIIYVRNGFLHAHDWVYVAILIVVAILGSWIGKRLLDKLSETTFSKIVLLMVFVSGMMLLLKEVFIRL